MLTANDQMAKSKTVAAMSSQPEAAPPSLTAIPDAPSSEDCHIITIPPEIRNQIYEYVFAVEEGAEVELTKATPPSKAIIMTCRQIYEEAKLMYKVNYHKFWTTSNFLIPLHWGDRDSDCRRAILADLAQVSARDVFHVTKISMPKEAWEWRFDNGIWSLFTGDSLWGGRRFITSSPEHDPRTIRRDCPGMLCSHIPWAPSVTMVEAGVVPALALGLLEKAKKTLSWKGLTKDELLAAVQFFV